MNLIDLFEELSSLKDDKELFEKRKDELIEQFINKYNYTDKERTAIKQFMWREEMALHNIKNPIVRLNKSIERFWSGFLEIHNKR